MLRCEDITEKEASEIVEKHWDEVYSLIKNEPIASLSEFFVSLPNREALVMLEIYMDTMQEVITDLEKKVKRMRVKK